MNKYCNMWFSLKIEITLLICSSALDQKMQLMNWHPYVFFKHCTVCESVLLDYVSSGTVGLPYYYLYPFIIILSWHVSSWSTGESLTCPSQWYWDVHKRINHSSSPTSTAIFDLHVFVINSLILWWHSSHDPLISIKPSLSVISNLTVLLFVQLSSVFIINVRAKKSIVYYKQFIGVWSTAKLKVTAQGTVSSLCKTHVFVDFAH